jgi:hypothetical protein
MGFGPLVTKDALANFRNKKEGSFAGGGLGSKKDELEANQQQYPSRSPVPSPKPMRYFDA